MSKCKYCGKSGLFFAINNNGLCNKCNAFVVLDIQNRVRIYNDCIRLIGDSENIDVVYLRIKVAIKFSISFTPI